MKKLGHYNLIQTDAGWHSTLCAGNNKVLLTSTKILDSLELAKSDIHFIAQYLIPEYSPYSCCPEKRESKDKKNYFCISYFNDPKSKRIDIYKSETYNTKQSMERGIKSVLANAKTTNVRIVDRRTKK